VDVNIEAWQDTGSGLELKSSDNTKITLTAPLEKS
jgi:hypothetical protein